LYGFGFKNPSQSVWLRLFGKLIMLECAQFFDLLNSVEIIFFDPNLEDFIEGLERPTLAKILRTLDLLEQFGNGLGMPHSKKIGQNLFELRIRGKQEIRIFYTFRKNTIVLLSGFVKKSQRIPRQWILLAKRRLDSLAT
jgi:phage-related protein